MKSFFSSALPGVNRIKSTAVCGSRFRKIHSYPIKSAKHLFSKFFQWKKIGFRKSDFVRFCFAQAKRACAMRRATSGNAFKMVRRDRRMDRGASSFASMATEDRSKIALRIKNITSLRPQGRTSHLHIFTRRRRSSRNQPSG